jgi:DNA-binding LacI/PurR family transcriptional regulator
MNSTNTKKRTTIEDVAAAVGVTKSTVSLVLANKGKASEARRQEIWRVARKMNYEPNPHAQRLVTGRSDNTIALFTLSLDLNVGTKKLQFLHSLLLSAGFEVPIYACGDKSQASEQVPLMKMLRLQRPRAIVLNTSGLVPETVELVERYQEEGGLVVSYDSPLELDCDQVIFDREDNTYQAVRYLLDLGHRDIALAEFEGAVNTDRFRGFKSALNEFGVEPNPDWMLDRERQEDAELFSNSYELSGVHMARYFLELSPRPTAVCLMDDYTAIGFVAELERLGVRVPNDVSIVSHDNSPIAYCGHLQLTTVAYPVKEIATAAFELLDHRLHFPDSPMRQVTIQGELKVRQSAAALSA